MLIDTVVVKLQIVDFFEIKSESNSMWFECVKGTIKFTHYLARLILWISWGFFNTVA